VPFAIICLSLVTLVVALALKRRTSDPKSELSTPVAIACVLAASAIVFGALAQASRDPWEVAASRRANGAAAPTLEVETLATGTQFPDVETAGWINGAPASKTGHGRVRVVDVWSSWCPMVTSLAPGLVQLQAKYRQKGVEFVSLSDDKQSTTTEFAKRFKIKWATAYGVPKDEIKTLGTLRPDSPGAEPHIAPTLYVVGPDGRVLWSDGAGRFHHKDSAQSLSELASVLDHALRDSKVYPAARSSS
jgi:thiol-disulfide isomerase/thioredoxin